MSLIITFFQRSNINNLKAYWRIIILMVLFVIFSFVFIKPKSDYSVFIPQLSETKTLWKLDKFNTQNFYPGLALIIEFRTVYQMIAVIQNVNRHIPPSWPVQIIHGQKNEEFIRKSTLAPFIESGKIFLTLMNQSYDKGGISHLLTNASFWKDIPGEKILFFQIDSIMCSTSPHKITDFLQYDFIGGPWIGDWYPYNKTYRVGNGGFSLRTRSKTLDLLAIRTYDNSVPEDVWYAQNLHRVNGSIPPIDIAKTFAVESGYYDRPVGVHHFPWSCEFRMNLSKTCPDSMLIWEERC